MFNAQKTDGGDAFTGDITFNKITLNIGNGMKSTGFVAPYSGHYRFSLSAMTGYSRFGTYNYVKVFLNGVEQFAIGDSNEDRQSDGNNLSYVWHMKVQKSQSVTLSIIDASFLNAGGPGSPYGVVPITFTGELVHLEN